jgi:hypothetical protein
MYRKPSGFDLALLILPVVLMPFLSGCATSRYGRGWGEDATALPGWERIGKAVKSAALDPYTWIPTAGAAVFGLTDLDESVSDWASDNTPLFGSQDCAGKASDNLRDASEVCWITTIILAPSGDDIGQMLTAKLKGSAVEVAAVYTTKNLTVALKRATERERPNGMDDKSFPSGHTSSAFIYSSLARTNLDWFDMNDGVRKTLQYGLTTVAAGTGWARIEAGVHYPSDVLFGAALGNFLSVFFTRAFLGAQGACPVGVSFAPTTGGAEMCINVLF